MSDWPYVRQYAGMAGGVSEQIGSEARQEAARDEYIADAMARLRQGLISLEEFRLFMQSRGGDELTQARPALPGLMHSRCTPATPNRPHPEVAT